MSELELPVDSKPAGHSPTASSARIVAIDVLRGFTLLGILMAVAADETAACSIGQPRE